MNYKNTVFLNLLIFLIGGGSLLAMEPEKKITTEHSITFGESSINTFFSMFHTPSIEEKVKHLYELGHISDINILRQELKTWGNDQEAWDRVLTTGSGPSPMMIARSNKYHGNSILLCNYNRSNDPFFQAIMFGDTSKIDNILNENPEKINTVIVLKDGCSCLPISWAISLEDEKLVRYLLKKGARIDIKTSIGLTPFDEACCSPKILELMAPYGGRELQRQKDFFEAAGKDDIKRMKEIVAHNAHSKIDIIRGSVGNNFTPLKCAVFGGCVKAAQYLINNGAFTNVPELDSYKRDLFLYACMSKKIPVIQLLVEESDIKFYLEGRFNKHCPFNYCLSDEVKQELFTLYKKHHTTTGQELLSLTAKLGHKNLILQTLNENININKYDSKKMTALLWACSYGNPDIMSFLIQHGADVNAVDKKGRCCLRKVIRMHKSSPQKYGRQLTTSELLPCLFLLACYGADKNIEDEESKSPLDWFKKQEFNEVERKLISRVLNACELSRDDLMCLLDDIYVFQCGELKQAEAEADDQAIYYIKKSLIKRENPCFQWLKPSLKDEYKNCIMLVGPTHITLTTGVFAEDVEKVIWFIAKQNEKGCNQLKIIPDKYPYATIDNVLYIEKVLKQIISLPPFNKSHTYERIPGGACLLTWD